MSVIVATGHRQSDQDPEDEADSVREHDVGDGTHRSRSSASRMCLGGLDDVAPMSMGVVLWMRKIVTNPNRVRLVVLLKENMSS